MKKSLLLPAEVFRFRSVKYTPPTYAVYSERSDFDSINHLCGARSGSPQLIIYQKSAKTITDVLMLGLSLLCSENCL